MKYLSVAVPCYNSAEYMERAVDSLLEGGEDVEILIVNDGSRDNTLEIARGYERQYPSIVRVIDKENGGHGDAVNVGLAKASGMYFKVVDSDDWVDRNALMKILDLLKEWYHQGNLPDMLISNYVYEKTGENHTRVIHYRNVLPQNKILKWGDIGRFGISQYILMHSVIYRTELLRECGLELPKHTFYVDNIYVYYPLPHVRTLYYLDVNFYRYFIGREDQSVNEKNMIQRVDQQVFVTKTMIDMYSFKKIPNRKLRNYMINYIAIMMTVSSIILIRSKKPENLNKKKELWDYLKKSNYWVYWKIRHSTLGETMNLPGKSGRKVSVLVYKVARRIIGFN